MRNCITLEDFTTCFHCLFNKFSNFFSIFSFLPPAYVVRGKVIFILGNVCLFTLEGGGVPRSRWGGSQAQVEVGGVPGPGGTRSQVRGGGGYPVLVKGKMFDTRFGLIHVQTRKKFLSRDPPPPPPQ